MRPMTPLFDDAVIDCVARDRAPSVRELFHVAQRIWSEVAADRSAFHWNRLAPTDPDRLLSLRAAHMALLGTAEERRTDATE